MFLGVNTVNLDAKGRMAIPAKHRGELADCCASKVVVTINPNPGEKCLWLYPESEWTEIARKLARLPNLKSQNRLFQRLLLGHASEQETDSQGRILISSELREYAGLGKKVAVVGQGHKFEIWDEATWAGNRTEWLEEVASPDGELSPELGELLL